MTPDQEIKKRKMKELLAAIISLTIIIFISYKVLSGK